MFQKSLFSALFHGGTLLNLAANHVINETPRKLITEPLAERTADNSDITLFQK